MSSISPGPQSSTPPWSMKNVTIDDTDSSLNYTKGWNRSVSSSAHGGSFQSSDNVGDVVHFSLPANAVAVYYFGFKQTSGSLCEACLDCSSDSKGQLDVVDGHGNDSGSNEPTLLYQKDNLDPKTRHSLALVNVPDTRFGNHSIITVDSFIVTVKEEQCQSIDYQGFPAEVERSFVAHLAYISSSASMSTMSSMSSMPSVAMSSTNMATNGDSPPQTQAAHPTSISMIAMPTPSASSVGNAEEQGSLSAGQRSAQKLRSPLALTGVILAVLFVVFTALFALMYFMRRRKRRKTAPGKMFDEGHWAARFFGSVSGERGSIWAGKRGASSSAEKGERIIAKQGPMVEKLVADRPAHSSLPPRPDMSVRPPPVSNLQLPPRDGSGRQWVQPAYHPYNAYGLPPRTVPRSAFVPVGRPPTSPDTQDFQEQNETGRLARMQSTSATYTRPPKSAPAGSVTVPGLPRNSVASQHPYVAEARARVRDRARGITDVDRDPFLNGAGQTNAYYANVPPVPPIPSSWNAGSGPMPGTEHVYAPGGSQPYHARNQNSWGSQYSQ
ncbi:hypothetical protein ACEPAG_149 [Sanghuangporus baumii]